MAFTIDVLIERSEMSVDELARQSRLDVHRVAAIIEGRWLASPTERQRIAEVFGVSVTEIDWGHFMNPRNVRYHRFGLKTDFRNGIDETER